MSAYLSPIGNEVQTDANGAPLSGGQIFTYLAGTTTPAATYTASDGVTQQSNPIVLNTRGLPDNPIWIGAGVSMKFVIKDANNVTLRTVDNILGVNDPANVTAQDEWVTFAGTSTYISTTSFSVAGDQTGVFQQTRRVKTTNAGGTVYSTVTAVSFNGGTGLTTVTLSNDSGSLDAGLSAVSYGLLSVTNPSVPSTYIKLLRGFIAGLTLSTAGGSATFSVSAGQAADSTNTALLDLAASISKTTAAWAVGTGNGGLDTGAIANNTWYHVYIIRRSDTLVRDVIFSLSAAAPTLPANYTLYRRIGSMKTNGAAQWTAFVQDGDLFQWITPVLDINAASSGAAAVTRTLASVPTGVNVRAFLNAGATAGAAGEGVYLSDLSTSDLVPAATASPLNTCSAAINTSNFVQAIVRTNTSAQIRSRQAVGGASETLRIATIGWFDTRGRDS